MNKLKTSSEIYVKKNLKVGFFAKILSLTAILSLALCSALKAQECPPIAVPSVIDFESVTATPWNVRGELPACWNYSFLGTDSTYAPHVSEDFAPQQQGLLLTSGDSVIYGITNTAIIPSIAASYRDLSISFITKMETEARGSLFFGYMHDNGVATYFMTLGAVPSSTQAVSHYYSLRDLDIPEGEPLAFLWLNTDSCAHCSIDSIAFDYLELCLPPTITSMAALSESQVHVEWARGWQEQIWLIEYGPTGFAHGNGTQQLVYQTNFDMVNLAPQTVYDFYVRGVCTSGSSTDWSAVGQVATPCTPVAIPYYEDMESYAGTGVSIAGVMPDCWNSLSIAAAKYAPHVSTYNAPHGSNGLVMTAKVASGYAGDNYVVVPAFSSDLNGLKISFLSRVDNANQGVLTLGYMTNVMDAGSFTALQVVSHSGTAVESHEYSLASYSFPAGARLAFLWSGTFTGWDWRCVIDDIAVEFLPCAPVSNVQVSDVMMTTATVSWNPGNTESQWRLEYGPAGYNHDATGVGVILNDTTYQLANLVGNQPYDVYVQALCDPNNPSPYSDVMTFTPYCSVVGDTAVVAACDSFVWHGNTFNESGFYIDTLFQAANYHCDSIVALDLTINHSMVEFDTLSICQNELPYTWRDTVLEVGTTDADFTFYRHTINSCDSIVNLALTVYPAFYQEESETICQQELPYTWRDTVFQVGTETGDFFFVRHTQHGCDSLVTLHLTVNPSYYQTEIQEICQQDLPYTWRDTVFQEGTASGIFTLNRTTVHGCDSIVTFVLIVDPAYDETHELTLCRSELPYTWRDITIAADAQSDVLHFTSTTTKGCDSLVTLNLVINEASSSEETIEICETELPYVWRNQVFAVGTTSDDYVYYGTNAAGCDSTATLHLTVRPTYARTLSATICESDLPYTFGDTTFQVGSETQTAVRHLTTRFGCDSIVTLNLTVNHGTSRYETLSICHADLPYLYYDTTFHVGTPSGTYAIYRHTSQGCDSIVYLTLNVRQGFGASETVTVCEDELPIIWHNEIIAHGTPSGTYTYARQSQYGCDSIMVLKLVVNPTYRENEEVTICESELPYAWRDTIFEVGTRGGNYLFEKHSAHGCDSVVTLKLTVKPTYDLYDEVTICASELPYAYNSDIVFAVGTQSGDFQYRYVAAGCDSILNIHLTVYPVVESNDYLEVCENDLPITYMGTTFPVGTETTSRDFHFYTSHGCDSTVHFYLTVNHTYSSEDEVTVCATDLPYYYEEMDTTFEVGTHSGNYVFPRATAQGCDDIHTLHLTVNPIHSEAATEIICQNELPLTWRDTVFAVGSQSGVYQFSRTAATGCDSLVTLALIIHPSYEQFESAEICDNGFPFTWRDTVFQAGSVDGDYVFYRHTIHGCDSIVTLHLTIYPTYEQNESLTVCESDLPYTWRNITFPVGTQSQQFTYNRSSMHGCDSIVHLQLTVRPTYSRTYSLQLCENDLPYYYAQTDTTFAEGTVSGIYRFEYQNVYGCDSIVLVNVSVYPYYEGEESLTICSGDLPYYYERENYTFQVGSSSCDREFHHYTAHGCDSVWTLHLTINQSYTRTELLRVCENDLPYTWNDTVFGEGTISGSFTFHRQTVNGCDSTVVLTLFIDPQPNVHIIGSSSMDLGDNPLMLVAQASGCDFVWSTGEETSVIYVAPDSAGTFTYTVTATHLTTGCSNEASHTIIVRDTTDGVADYVNESHLSVYPNPAVDVVTVRSENEMISEVCIYNMMGTLVRKVRVDDFQTELDLSNVAPGTYLLKMKMHEGGVVSKKLIIK